MVIGISRASAITAYPRTVPCRTATFTGQGSARRIATTGQRKPPVTGRHISRERISGCGPYTYRRIPVSTSHVANTELNTAFAVSASNRASTLQSSACCATGKSSQLIAVDPCGSFLFEASYVRENDTSALLVDKRKRARVPVAASQVVTPAATQSPTCGYRYTNESAVLANARSSTAWSEALTPE
jgi:hypothetical protein